jgi:hypothetical protein
MAHILSLLGDLTRDQLSEAVKASLKVDHCTMGMLFPINNPKIYNLFLRTDVTLLACP